MGMTCLSAGLPAGQHTEGTVPSGTTPIVSPDPVQPLKATQFMEAAIRFIEPLRGTHVYRGIYRDLMEKTGAVTSDYGRWLRGALAYLTSTYCLVGRRVLDFGCGTGELTVLMRTLGYEAYGYDVHERHLGLARILGAENGVPPEAFVLKDDGGEPNPRLPFPDRSFDVITLLSVLEHLSDATLGTLLPELRRICRGVIYVLVPNRMKPADDHTGLRFICWMPRCVAVPYVRLRGHVHGYHISVDGTWDVHYRTFRRVKSIAQRFGFHVDFPPDEYIYPPFQTALTHLTKRVQIVGRTVTVSLPTPWNRLFNRGCPPQGLYPYLNMVWTPAGHGAEPGG